MGSKGNQFKMKRKIIIKVILISIFLTGCFNTGNEENNIIFLDYKQDKVILNNQIVDEDKIEVVDKWNGLQLYYDRKLQNLWVCQQIENNYFQFNFINPIDKKITTYEKKFDDIFKISQGAIEYIYNSIAVIKSLNSYILYDIINDHNRICKCENVYFLGYNEKNLYFTDGFYNIQGEQFQQYNKDVMLQFRSVYCPSENLFLTYDKDKRITIFNPETGNKEILKIRANLSNFSDDKSIYYLHEDKIYFSKHKFYIKDFLPIKGYYHLMTWYEYDLKTKKIKKIKTPSYNCVIIGVVKYNS